MSGCVTCGGPLGKRNMSGRCRSCAARAVAADPVIRAKASATVKQRVASDPVFAAALVERARLASQSRDPAVLSEAARESRFWEKAIGRRWNDGVPGDDRRKRVGARIRATKLDHIPSDYRQAYRDLIVSGVRAEEATRVILDQVEIDRRRMRADMMEAA